MYHYHFSCWAPEKIQIRAPNNCSIVAAFPKKRGTDGCKLRIHVQNATFVAESRTVVVLEGLYAGAVLAQVCAGSGTDFWSLGIPEAARRAGQDLLQLPLRLATDRGSPQALKSYGLTFYHAIEALPVLYAKTRCRLL
jgi:hypothetical protein